MLHLLPAHSCTTPSLYLHQQQRSSSAGVVGGVAALMVISSALWCFSKRCSLAARDELGHHHALVNTESSDIGFALGRASAPQLPIPRRKAAWPTSNSSSTTRIGAGAVFSDGQDLGGRPGFVDSQQKPFLSGSNSWSEGSWVEMQPAAAQLDSPDAATKAVHHMSLASLSFPVALRCPAVQTCLHAHSPRPPTLQCKQRDALLLGWRLAL